jgi:excisionase family DNA binding protein
MRDDDGWLTTEEAAGEVGRSADWVRARIQEGRLVATAWRVGSRRVYRIAAADWDEFVRAHSVRTDDPDFE